VYNYPLLSHFLSMHIGLYISVYYVVLTEEHRVSVVNSTCMVPDRIFLTAVFF